jgi:hypothetical protein
MVWRLKFAKIPFFEDKIFKSDFSIFNYGSIVCIANWASYYFALNEAIF